MATRARFGRLPRSAPSLTSTIVALAQQYQNKRDSNIEDAWKNGGQFEGKQVTDEMFLEHWKGRLADVSAGDPMYDYYQNLVHNYTFMISESKMGQKYAEKKVSDGQMANFYRTEAAKLPVASEAYRNLMTQAAKFQSAATARGNGGRARAAAKAYADAQNSTYKTHEVPYAVATSLIMRYALEAGYIDTKDYQSDDYGWSKMTNAAGENDPANFSAMLTDLQNNPAVSKYITAQIKANGDPNFSGAFNEQTLSSLANTARNGATIRYNRATKNGKKDDATGAQKAMDQYSMSATIIRVSMGTSPHFSFVEQNEHYRAQMDAVLNPNSGASPLERSLAVQTYKDWLGSAGAQTYMNALPAGSLDPTSGNFDAVAAGITGRIQNTLNMLNGKATGQTLKDDLYGFSTAEAGATSDAVKTSTAVNALNTGLTAVANGTGIVVRTNSAGKPDQAGTDWNIFDRNAPEVYGNDNLVPVVIPAHGSYSFENGRLLGGDQGEVRYNVASPVEVRVWGSQDPGTGAYTNKITPVQGSDAVVGKQIDIVGPGGVPVTIYGTYQGGRLVWSTVDPFQQNPTEKITRDADGTVVRNFSALGAPGPVTPGSPKQSYNPQEFIDQNQLMSPTTKQNWNPGSDKQTAFDSPLAAFGNASSEHMQYLANLGDAAVNRAEVEWYTNPSNWTPDMKQQASQGIPPVQVVTQKSQQLIRTIQYDRAFGYTPEEQNATRSMYAQQDVGARAERAGISAPAYQAQIDAANQQARRADLASSLQEWSINNTPAPTTRRTFSGDRIPITTPGTSPLPKGWSVGDLLNQPGMSLAQANDLVYQISGGKAGQLFIGPQAGPALVPTGLVAGQPTQYGPAPANPFLPKPGQAGPSFRLPGIAPAPAPAPVIARATEVPVPYKAPTPPATPPPNYYAPPLNAYVPPPPIQTKRDFLERG